MIRIGIVGSGGMASQRARLFNETRDARTAAVCSNTPERAEAVAKRAGAQAFARLEDMLPHVDAVAVCTVNTTHTRLVRQALQAGKHALAEYPLCTSMDEADMLRRLARETGRVLMVGNTIIHEAMFQYLRKHQPRLGRILSGASRVAFYGPSMAGRWYMNAEVRGSVFAGFHYHHIEYYRHFLGEAQWALAQDESQPDPARPGCASSAGGTLVMGHEGGRTSCVQWHLHAQGSGLPRGLWLNGTESSVTVISRDPKHSTVVWGGGEGAEEVYEDDWGVAASCRDFIEAAAGRLDHRARLDWDIATLRVGLTASESAQRNELVRLL